MDKRKNQEDKEKGSSFLFRKRITHLLPFFLSFLSFFLFFATSSFLNLILSLPILVCVRRHLTPLLLLQLFRSLSLSFDDKEGLTRKRSSFKREQECERERKKENRKKKEERKNHEGLRTCCSDLKEWTGNWT